MSETDLRSPERLSHALRESENAVEEQHREDFLSKNLFHNDFLANPDLGLQDVMQLNQKFMAAKRDLNMGQRFALALEPEFLDRIHTVELGLSTDPSISSSVDLLKFQYHQFLEWLIKQNIVTEELSREEASQQGGRDVSFRKPVLSEAQNSQVVVVRNRLLVHGNFEHESTPIKMAIAKRMIFAMPTHMLAVVGSTVGTDCKDEKLNRIIENLLENTPQVITPIRTGYYLQTRIDKSND